MSKIVTYLSNEEILETARRAYTFGYPLVLMDQTKKVSTNVRVSNPFGHAPINQISRVRKSPNASFQNVVKPNVDTYYTVAWLDLSDGPLVLTVPNTDGRYYLLPLLDAYSNIFASIGSRTTKNHAGKFIISGPDWKEKDLLGKEHIHYSAPTNLVWMLGRVMVEDFKDGEEVVWPIQNNIKLKPLNGTTPSVSLGNKTELSGDSPADYLKKMKINDFFNRMMQLMVDNPPAKRDFQIVHEMAKIKIVPNTNPDFEVTTLTDNQEIINAINSLPNDSYDKWTSMQPPSDVSLAASNGWNIQTSHKGAYGIHYTKRAYQACTGLGANLPEDAVYPTMTKTFRNGVETNIPLNGKHAYTLKFATEADLPPVNGFWSLTAYNNRNLFVYNPINRYALKSSDTFNYHTEDDAYLTFYIQADDPGGDKSANWLPVPPSPLPEESLAIRSPEEDSSNFSLTMRLYWPKDEVLNFSWMPPAVNLVSQTM